MGKGMGGDSGNSLEACSAPVSFPREQHIDLPSQPRGQTMQYSPTPSGRRPHPCGPVIEGGLICAPGCCTWVRMVRIEHSLASHRAPASMCPFLGKPADVSFRDTREDETPRTHTHTRARARAHAHTHAHTHTHIYRKQASVDTPVHWRPPRLKCAASSSSHLRRGSLHSREVRPNTAWQQNWANATARSALPASSRGSLERHLS
jgi:hypothetical protein